MIYRLSALAALVFLAGGVPASTSAQDAWKKAVSAPNAPAAIGPYSQGVRAGNMVFLAGQLPLDPKTKQMVEGAAIEDHVRVVLDNISALLAAEGMTMGDIVFTTVYLKDLNDFAKMNDVYATYFKAVPPARATLEVSRLPRDARIEIVATAMSQSSRPQ
jgi:2-iminobutanoate/2-iminopropanoate deaminase